MAETIMSTSPCDSCYYKNKPLKEQVGVCADAALTPICYKLNSALIETLRNNELIHGNYKDVEYLYKEIYELNEDIAQSIQYDKKSDDELMAEDERVAEILRKAENENLTEKEAQVFYEVYQDGLRIVPLAKKLGKSHQAVSKVYQKAVMKLREVMTPIYPEIADRKPKVKRKKVPDKSFKEIQCPCCFKYFYVKRGALEYICPHCKTGINNEMPYKRVAEFPNGEGSSC
jgi:hypothetical protein